MTAKKKPTISAIMALQKQADAARTKYYRLDEKLHDASTRMDEGTVEEGRWCHVRCYQETRSVQLQFPCIAFYRIEEVIC